MKILVTGTAGFIGFHVANRLIKDGHHVTGIDSINAYYDAKLKVRQAGICRHFLSRNTIQSPDTKQQVTRTMCFTSCG